MIGKIKTYLRQLTWLERIWLLAPIFIWFSYQPQISLGGDNTMNYELSLTLIYAVVLALVGLPTIWRARHELMRDKYVWLVTVFVGWTGLSVLWSANQLRGFLTFGITGVLWLIFLAAYARKKRLRELLPALTKVLIASSVAVCLLALGQMILGVYIQSRQSLWLCAGCVAGQFGFVRPNLFVIEPQFLGSMLLAPMLIMTYRLIERPRNWRDSVVFILLLTTLGLTLSRGAIYAGAVGIAIMWLTVRGRWLNKLASVDLMIISVILCLAVQGGLAAINPHITETFWGAVTKSVDHLTMGIFDLQATPTTTQEKADVTTPVYDGYVAESTDVRVNLTKTALASWTSQDLTGRLFGVGLGSAGKAMAQHIGSNYEKEIVQNEYAEVLLERGLVGLLLLIAVIAMTFYRLRHQKWLWAILAAFLVQYCFFSGLPNALHVYLIICWLLAL
ncbi:MAG: O-antigen ligase family protein [Candidatus Saccharibacteria bacterium]|nr:O-antigen ligase family protein [Candidatus Saccharibacteria bacterium]